MNILGFLGRKLIVLHSLNILFDAFELDVNFANFVFYGKTGVNPADTVGLPCFFYFVFN